MKIIRNLGLLVETVRRFPAASLLALANSVSVCWFIDCAHHHGALLPVCMLAASAISIPLSVIAGMAAEHFNGRRAILLAAQAGVLVFFAALSALFYSYGEMEEHFGTSFAFAEASVLALCIFAMGSADKSAPVLPKCFFAGIVGCAAAFLVAGGLSIVLFALDELFGVNINDDTYGKIWLCSFATLATEFTIAYALRREAFAVPKVWKVIAVYVAMPVFLLLIAVLWAYFAKCVLKWDIPRGQINWFVSGAVAAYMLLHLLMEGMDGGAARLFRRWGMLLVLPLVPLQAVAINMRIAQYGLSPMRYASILFVVFATAYGICTLASPSFSRRWGYALFAAVTLFAAVSPWNVTDVGVRAQRRLLEEFRRRLKSGEDFDQQTRYAIMGTVEFNSRYEKVGGIWREKEIWKGIDQSEFKNEWGFNFEGQWDRRNPAGGNNVVKHYTRNMLVPIDVAGFLSMYADAHFDYRNGSILAVSGSNSVEVTEQLLDAMGNEEVPKNIVLDLPNGDRIIPIYISMYFKTEEDASERKFDSAYGSAVWLRYSTNGAEAIAEPGDGDVP